MMTSGLIKKCHLMYSLGEVEAISKKAAKAAGLTWGEAMELSNSIRNLARVRLPSVEAFIPLLQGLNAGKFKRHGKLMAWLNRRLTITTLAKAWEETPGDFGARLRQDCDYINTHYDVRALCRELPERCNFCN